MSRIVGFDKNLDGATTHVRIEVSVPVGAIYLHVDKHGGYAHIAQGFVDDARLTVEEWTRLEEAGVQVPNHAHRVYPMHGPEEFCPLREQHGRMSRVEGGRFVCARCGRPAAATPDNPEARLLAGMTPGGKGIYHISNGRGRALCRAANAALAHIVYAERVPLSKRCKMKDCALMWQSLGGKR